MYLRTVQLGIQDMAGHPWLVHACVVWAGICFCVWVSMHAVVVPLFCRLQLHEKTPEHQQVCAISPLCSLSKSPEFSSNPRERISIVGVSESALDKFTGCCSLWV